MSRGAQPPRSNESSSGGLRIAPPPQVPFAQIFRQPLIFFLSSQASAPRSNRQVLQTFGGFTSIEFAIGSTTACAAHGSKFCHSGIQAEASTLPSDKVTPRVSIEGAGKRLRLWPARMSFVGLFPPAAAKGRILVMRGDDPDTTGEAMIKRTCHSTIYLLLPACSQLPPAFSPSIASATSTGVELGKCSVTATSSGVPRRYRENELRPAVDAMSNYAKWTVEGWVFEQYRFTESAICMCRDYPYTRGERVAVSANIQAQLRTSVPREFTDASLGVFFDYDVPIESPAAKDRVRVLYPTKADSCLAYLSTRMPVTETSGSQFFLRLSPSGAAPSSPSAPAARSNAAVAERLRQLDSLLKEQLITQEEYSERRRRILEAL